MKRRIDEPHSLGKSGTLSVEEFVEKLTDRINNPRVTVQERRLDSLARLLEGNSTCVAVCFDGYKILIACNAVHKKSRSNQHIDLIDTVMQHLTNVANGVGIDQEGRRKVFHRICKQYLGGRKYNLGIEEVLVDLIFNDSLSGKHRIKELSKQEGLQTKAAQIHSGILKFIQECLNSERNTTLGDLLRTSEGVTKVAETASIIFMLLTDLKKVEQSLTKGKDKKTFEPKIIEAIARGKKGYELLREGEDKLHAEMRIVTKLLEKEELIIGEVYVGISKLCCLKCSLALRAVNEVSSDPALKRRRIKEGLGNVDSEERNKQISRFVVKYRGQHGTFKAKGKEKKPDPLPEFLQGGKNPFWNKIAEVYKRLWAEVGVERTQPAAKGEEKSNTSDKKPFASMHTTPSGSGASSELDVGITVEAARDAKRTSGIISNEELLNLLRERVQAGTINIEKIFSLLNLTEKGIGGGDVHAKTNAFNCYNDNQYLYQGSDISAIGEQLTRGMAGVCFTKALATTSNYLDASAQLKEFTKQVNSGFAVVGVYNAGGRHWTAFKLIPSNDPKTPGKKRLRVLYKDSFGNPPDELFQLALINVFGGEFDVDMRFSKGVEQRKVHTGSTIPGDGINCGIFASRNLQVLAQGKGNDIGDYEFYAPELDAGGYEASILRLRREYALLYVQEVHLNIQEDLRSRKEKEFRRRELQGKVNTLADLINNNEAFKKLKIKVIALSASRSMPEKRAKKKKLVSLEVATIIETNDFVFRMKLSQAIEVGERQGVVDAIGAALGLDKSSIEYDSKSAVLRINPKHIKQVDIKVGESKGGIGEEVGTSVIEPEEVRQNLVAALNIGGMKHDDSLTQLATAVEGAIGVSILEPEQSKMFDDSIIDGLQKNGALYGKFKKLAIIINSNRGNQKKIEIELKEELAGIKGDLVSAGIYQLLVKKEEDGEIVELQAGAGNLIVNLAKKVQEKQELGSEYEFKEGDRRSSGSRADSEASGDGEWSIPGYDDNENLKRSEKRALNAANIKELLRSRLPESQYPILKRIIKRSEAMLKADDMRARSLAKLSANAVVTLMPEQSHTVDHRKYVRNLVMQIKEGRILPGTIICLERKQYGHNLGMHDVILIANILRYNRNNVDQMSLPDEITSLPIYEDARLYNIAKEKGIMVVGVEGKGIKRDKSCYVVDREAHMVKVLLDMSQTTTRIIFPVGSWHIAGISLALRKSNVHVDSELNSAIATSTRIGVLEPKTMGVYSTTQLQVSPMVGNNRSVTHMQTIATSLSESSMVYRTTNNSGEVGILKYSITYSNCCIY